MNEELRVVITANISDLERNTQRARDSVEDFGDQSEKAMKAVDDAMEKTKDVAKKAMVGFGAALAAGAASLAGIVESTRDYRTAQAKLTSSFEDAGKSAESAYKTYDELNSVIGDMDVAVEASQQISLLADSEQDAAKWADLAAGVVAKFGDALTPETFYEAANETVKLGEATGAYTQMLEQAGEDVDDFNDGLKKCKTYADKQKYALEKANKVLGNASKQYKENNKEIIANNKATEKWNKSLGNIGKSFEPVMTSLKDFGASILEDLEEPMEDVAEIVTEDILPALKDGFEWLADNMDIVAGVAAGATTAMIGYKAAVWAGKLAEEGLTVAMVARTAAQKALNLVTKADPYMLVVSAIGALVTGLTAWAAASQEAEAKTTILTEEELKLKDSVNEAAEAFQEQQEAFSESAKNIQAESSYMTDLADELQNLADKSGKVKEADEARAQFILNELNEAYGTEFEMVDGVIQNYDNLKTKIYEVIEAKTANALLEAANENYIAAIQNESEALQNVINTERDYTAQLEVTNEAKSKAADARAALDKKVADAKTESDYRSLASEAKMVEGLETNAKKQEGILEKRKADYDLAAENYGNYSNTINNYENAQTAILQGNYKKATDILAKKGISYFEYSKDVDQATQKAINALYQEAIEAGIEAKRTKENFENGVEGYTEDMVKESEQAYDKALGAWKDAYNQANGIGKDMGDGLSSGLGSKENSLVRKARNIVNNIWSAMRRAADSHSPSRKTRQLGKDLDAGLYLGMDEDADKATKSGEKLVQKSLAPIEASLKGISLGNFNNLSNTSSLFNNLQNNIKGLNNNNSQWMNTLANILNNKGGNTKLVLQVDKKVLGEITVDGINDITRQTGSLPLVIV